MNKKDIVLSLINHFADGNKTLFANKLGVKPQTISTWISRDTLDIDKIFANCDGLNAEWLLTGDGNMLKTDSALKIIIRYISYPIIAKTGCISGLRYS